MQDASDEYFNAENTGSSGYVEISTTAAILFVVLASCFLVMLYKLMSFWFVEVLVVLFCVGGVEVRYSCARLCSCWLEFIPPSNLDFNQLTDQPDYHANSSSFYIFKTAAISWVVSGVPCG